MALAAPHCDSRLAGLKGCRCLLQDVSAIFVPCHYRIPSQPGGVLDKAGRFFCLALLHTGMRCCSSRFTTRPPRKQLTGIATAGGQQDDPAQVENNMKVNSRSPGHIDAVSGTRSLNEVGRLSNSLSYKYSARRVASVHNSLAVRAEDCDPFVAQPYSYLYGLNQVIRCGVRAADTGFCYCWSQRHLPVHRGKKSQLQRNLASTACLKVRSHAQELAIADVFSV